MKKKINLPKIKFLRYFDQKKIGSIPRIFISSIMLIFFFYSAPAIINYAKNDNEYKNNSKEVLAYTLNKKKAGIEDGITNLDENLTCF